MIHIIAVPSDGRIRDLKDAAASLVVGPHVPDVPMSQVKLRRIDQTDTFGDDEKILDTGLTAMDWVHLVIEAAPPAGSAS